MLTLTREDLSPGVNTWWPTLPGRRRRPLTISWTGLVLIAPQVLWPEGVHPYREKGWGGEYSSFRFSWVKGLGRVVVQEKAPVMILDPCYEIEREAMQSLSPGTGTQKLGKIKFRNLTTREGGEVWVNVQHLDRVAAALGCEVQETTLRFARPEWSSTPMVLAYRFGSLRAILAALDEVRG